MIQLEPEDSKLPRQGSEVGTLGAAGLSSIPLLLAMSCGRHVFDH